MIRASMRRPRPTLAFLCAAAVLAGCASTEDAAKPKDTAPEQAETAPRGADPIARYVLSAQPGDSARLTLDGGRRIQVVVGRMYTSATGARCQRITLRSQEDASRVSAVCRQKGSWQTVLLP